MSQPMLKLEKISKYFPGIKALDDVHLVLYPGEVHALVGENGAGKSTLVKIITGVYQPTNGKIYYKGEELDFANALEAQKHGIAAIHQEASMFPELSVTENIFMGHHIKHRGRIDWKEMRNHTAALLKRMDLNINPSTTVKNLSTAERHMVEIAKALSIDADLVIMDEPTSALSLREIEDLYKIIRQLNDAGKAVLFISHKFDEIFEICDKYTVFRDGKYIGEGPVEKSALDKIITMMVGRSLDQMFPKAEVKITDPILEVKNFTRTGYFKDISFTLRKGEILGFFGLVGAGRTEIMRALFGIDKASSGEVVFKGKQVAIHNPKTAMKLGIVYIPEDRHEQGAIQDMSITHNITLPVIDELSPLGITRKAAEQETVQKYGTLMEIKAASWDVALNTLSGGNQQKVVIAKWLATHPKVLIMDEPTKGIDVATKAAVHRFVSSMAEKGLAVILVSSELPEIEGMSDRIIVMHEGRVTAEYERGQVDSETIIRAATGNLKEQSA